MNQAHLHLLLNHLPILGTLFGLLILAGGFLLKNDTVKRTALGIFVLSAILAIPAYLTGEGAEEVVEGLPGVTENLIEAHEDMANIFLWMVGALGLIALATFYTDLKSKEGGFHAVRPHVCQRLSARWYLRNGSAPRAAKSGTRKSEAVQRLPLLKTVRQAARTKVTTTIKK
jgi:uncharacterized membrane protein